MRPLSDTLTRLARLKALAATAASPGDSTLSPMTGFGSNPGALLASVFIPTRPAQRMPLVVVLHGCTQTAADYDRGSGWSALAEQAGFALLFPGQQRQNNANACFNWFEPGDTARDHGEALSIRQMIAHMCQEHAIDPGRIYITGLSAGGAMASVMLAAYPEIFAGGAIIAGLPHGCATSVSQAFDRMRGHGLPTQDRLSAAVTQASIWQGPWPAVSVWQGDADTIVSAANAQAIAAQWRGVHRISDPATIEDLSVNHRRQRWHDADGRAAVEIHTIAGMGHGTPISQRDGPGKAGPYFLEVGISSTRQIAEAWNLASPSRPQASSATTPLIGAVTQRPKRATQEDSPRKPDGVGRIKSVIEEALRTAGLMR